jgi:hypothetical protein
LRGGNNLPIKNIQDKLEEVTAVRTTLPDRIIILINPGIKRLHVIRESGWTIRGITVVMAEEGTV